MLQTCTLFLVLIVALVGTGFGKASQHPTSRVTGTVKDDAGGVLPNATITFKTRKRQTKVVSRGDGSFVIDLPAGTYRVVAKIAGCRDFKRERFEPRAGESLNLDITLNCPPTPIRSSSTSVF